eukprot:3227997-Amphidinium_carterae.2
MHTHRKHIKKLSLRVLWYSTRFALQTGPSTVLLASTPCYSTSQSVLRPMGVRSTAYVQTTFWIPLAPFSAYFM